LTQFNSVSLHRHISRTYNFDVYHPGWVQIWAAEQTPTATDWYQGTADAVRKQIIEIRNARKPFTLILAGDHLYRMNYSKMADYHWEKKADVTVAVQPVSRKDAPRLGLLKRDCDERIVRFAEKPKDASTLESMASSGDPEKPFFGSMGIYLFNTDVLLELLEKSTEEDFGSHIIPLAVQTKNVYGYAYGGYWADIGTIRSFYDTNIALASNTPPFSLIDEGWPIYTHPRFLPASIVEDARLHETLLAEGCWIKGAEINDSVIGLRSQIRPGAVINETIMMGADYYGFFRRGEEPEGEIGLGIGRDCHVSGAIIDKNVRLGAGTVIEPFPRGTDIDHATYTVRDGIVVIPKNMQLPPGTRIGP
jgi:glucose-1-phosphate adenylyltransferase